MVGEDTLSLPTMPSALRPWIMTDDDQATFTEDVDPIEGINDADIPLKEIDDASEWGTLLTELEKHDKDLTEGWKDELNNLLIFAGLFSAVVTAFTVESYSWLQQDPNDTSATLLAQILSELASSRTGVGSNTTSSSTEAPGTSPSFSPSEVSINVNILWILSLTLSLIAAFFAIAVQQWLRQFHLSQPMHVRELVRLRQLRHHGLVVWQVPSIVSLLPVLLQFAVILFLVGLLLLLHSLNSRVAQAFTIVAGIGIALFILTAVIPLFNAECPYKSPLIPTLLVALQWCTYPFTIPLGLVGIPILMLCPIPLPVSKFELPTAFLTYLRHFGSHMVVDITSFWARGESNARLAREAWMLDCEALSRSFSRLDKRTVVHIKTCLQHMAPLHRMECILLGVARVLGPRLKVSDIISSDYHNPVNPKVLQDAKRLLPTLFAELMLEALPREWTVYDWQNRRVSAIMVLLDTMADSLGSKFQAPFVKMLIAVRSGQSPDIARTGVIARWATIILYNRSEGYAFTPDEVHEALHWTVRYMRRRDVEHYSVVTEVGLTSVAAVLVALSSQTEVGGTEEKHISIFIETLTDFLTQCALPLRDTVSNRAMRSICKALAALAHQHRLPLQGPAIYHLLQRLEDLLPSPGWRGETAVEYLRQLESLLPESKTEYPLPPAFYASQEFDPYEYRAGNTVPGVPAPFVVPPVSLAYNPLPSVNYSRIVPIIPESPPARRRGKSVRFAVSPGRNPVAPDVWTPHTASDSLPDVEQLENPRGRPIGSTNTLQMEPVSSINDTPESDSQPLPIPICECDICVRERSSRQASTISVESMCIPSDMNRRAHDERAQSQFSGDRENEHNDTTPGTPEPLSPLNGFPPATIPLSSSPEAYTKTDLCMPSYAESVVSNTSVLSYAMIEPDTPDANLSRFYPPDGWIPYMDDDRRIRLPPPHELARPAY